MMDDGEGGDLTCPQRRRGRGRRKSARNKRGNNSVDRSVTDHRDEITDRIRPSFRRSTRSRTGGPRVPRFVGIPRVRSAPRAQRPTCRSPLKVVSHLGARDGDGRLHPRQVSRRCQRPRALPREPARRDPRRRGAKARMVRDHVRVGWEVVPRGCGARGEHASGAHGGGALAIQVAGDDAPRRRGDGGGRRGARVADAAVRREGPEVARRRRHGSLSVGCPARQDREPDVLTREQVPVESGGVLDCGAGRAPGGAAVGASERVPVGRGCVLQSGGGRPPGGAAVGASERVRVGRDDVPLRGFGRPPGGAAVGASERVRVGREDVPVRGGWEATWRCCSGRVRTGARGTGGRAGARRREGTSRCCSGRVGTGARGTRRRARSRRRKATWRCCSGRVGTGASGT